MSALQAVVLGLVQGLTEFLPISSTAHLRLVPHFLGWADPGAPFSAAIQLGTLAAVLAYFAADIRRLAAAALDGARHRDLGRTPEAMLAWAIVPASVPIVAFGLAFKEFIETGARGLDLIAAALIVLAVLLLVAEGVGPRARTCRELTFWRIQVIGLCQALALIPGCSRSGSTIMGGLFVGLRRNEAARFSFLLGLPAIGGAGLFELGDLLAADADGDGLLSLGIGIGAAAVSGYASIGFLLRFLERHGTYAFAVYRIALGALIFWTLRA
jgi:undecaprenyl-diphosphatase